MKNEKSTVTLPLRVLSLMMAPASLATILAFSSPAYAQCWRDPSLCDPTRVIWDPPTIHDLERELNNAIDYLNRNLLPGVGQYFQYLHDQGSGRWQSLPDDFKSRYSQDYGFDLNNVRYATNINTVHGQGITVGNEIFFPREIDLNNFIDLHWMLHELEHVQQYAVVGGITPFAAKYLVQGGIEIGSRGSIDIHDNISLERDAEHKANRIAARHLGVAIDANVGRTIYQNEQPDLNNSNHLWRLIPSNNDNNEYFIVNNATGTEKTLDANYRGTQQNGPLYMYDGMDVNNGNHLWRFRKVDDDFYMITNQGNALDANGGRGAPYLNGNDDINNHNLYWRLTAYNDSYLITPLVAEVCGGPCNP